MKNREGRYRQPNSKISLISRGVILSMFFLYFFCLIPGVSADKITQISTGGLQIEYQKFEYFKIGEPFEINAHVYNSSGYPMNNDTVTCYFHAYNSNGTHAIDSQMLYDIDGSDFYLNIPGSAFTGGKASWIISCNSSGEGGFVSGPAIITPTGLAYSIEESINYIIIILAEILALIAFIILSIKTPGEDIKQLTKDGDISVKKITWTKYPKMIFIFMSIGLSILAITTLTGIVNNYINFDPLIKIMTTIYLVSDSVGWLTIRLMPIILLIMFWRDVIFNKDIRKLGEHVIYGK